AILSDLDGRARAVLREGGVAESEIGTELAADMRYTGQGFEITVPLDAAAVERRDTMALREAFDARYRERFARNLGGLAAEVVSWRLRLVAPPSVSEIRFADGGREAGQSLIGHCPAFFPEAGGFL